MKKEGKVGLYIFDSGDLWESYTEGVGVGSTSMLALPSEAGSSGTGGDGTTTSISLTVREAGMTTSSSAVRVVVV